MSKMMLLGMSLNDAVLRSTVNPAKEIGRYPELGTLSVGKGADITVLDLRKGVFALKDAWGAKRLTTTLLENAMTIRAGEIVYDRGGSPSAEPPEIYDILLRNGQVIDPANHRAGRYDVAVIGNKIARVGHDLPSSHARIAIDASRYYVTPGLIDIRAHFDSASAGRNLQPDHHCLPNGVTTAVLAGVAKRIEPAKTRLLAFVEPGQTGVNKAQVVGILATEENIHRALKAAEASNMIVMAEGAAAEGLRPGDIAPWLRPSRPPHTLLNAVGFEFRLAAPVIRGGVLPDTISTDVDSKRILLPRANMMITLSKFLQMGMTLDQVIERTTVNAAKAIRRPELGTLSEGGVADIALIEMEQGKFTFLDDSYARLEGNRRLRCVLTVRNGAIVWDTDGLSAPDGVKAGPYSNFK